MACGKIRILLTIIFIAIFLQSGAQKISLGLEINGSSQQIEVYFSDSIFQRSSWTTFPRISHVDSQHLTENKPRAGTPTLAYEPNKIDLPVLGYEETPVKVAYIYSTDILAADSYFELLELNGYTMDLIYIADITSEDMFAEYDLIVLGSDSGKSSSWGNGEQVAAIDNSQKPVLGLGEGGYAFFGMLNLAIGHPNGDLGYDGDKTSIFVMNDTHPVFTKPYEIGSGTVQVYGPTKHIGVHWPTMPSDVELFGSESASVDHYTLVQEKDRYMLWGYTSSPEKMTLAGKNLFINVIGYLTGKYYREPIYIDHNDDFAALGFPGNGNQDNPYRIEGYIIADSTTYLIHIQDTDAYFRINSNILDGISRFWDGIYLSNVKNGEISGNTIYRCGNGVFLHNSDDNIITGNTIFDCGQDTVEMQALSDRSPPGLMRGIGHGIYLDPSNNNEISDNTIAYNWEDGVFLEGSEDNSITGNIIFCNGKPLPPIPDAMQATSDRSPPSLLRGIGHGIYLDPTDNNEIRDNYVIDNAGDGIFLEYSDDITVSGNFVYKNGISGVHILGNIETNVEGNAIEGNIISGNELHSNLGSGIFLENTEKNKIMDNPYIFNNAEDGVSLFDSNDNSITNNAISGNGDDSIAMQVLSDRSSPNLMRGIGHGIYLDPSDNNEIRGNTVINNDGSGVALVDSNYNTISDNTIEGNGYGSLAMQALSDRSPPSLMRGIGHGIYLDPSDSNEISGNTVIDNAVDGIYLYDSDANTVSDNEVSGNGANGLHVHNEADPNSEGNAIGNTITLNNIHNNLESGVFLENTDKNTISDNSICDNGPSSISGTMRVLSDRSRPRLMRGIGHGIYLDPSEYNTISNNLVKNNDGSGVALADSNYNTISDNTIEGNGYGSLAMQALSDRSPPSLMRGIGHGIYLDPSKHNTINNNVVRNNAEDGVFLQSSDETDLIGNIITENGLYGVEIVIDSDDNTIALNNFEGNNVGETQAFDIGSGNLFAYNYWSDHDPTDEDGDGIADNPYIIEGETNQDSYSKPTIVPVDEHFIQKPIVLSPQYHDKLHDEAIISWFPSFDSQAQDFTYEIFISDDAGKSWKPEPLNPEPLDQETTSWTWIIDYSIYKVGSRYKLKIIATSSVDPDIYASAISEKFEIFKVKKAGFKGQNADNAVFAIAIDEERAETAPVLSFIILLLSIIAIIPIRKLRRNAKN
ncbi:MAG: nitrous oxide reductase family maturation protein NosD [Candidatus Hodarchaeota archaeon]